VPYYHVGCRGEIKWYPFLPIPPKCTKCGKTWNPLVVYGPRRHDMYYVPKERSKISKASEKLKVKKGDTSYAKWADTSLPGVAIIASRLPSWPRWLRLTSFLGSVIILSGIYYGLYLLGIWAIIIGTIVIALSPVAILALTQRRNK
jgi:hypothetical protein